MIAKHPPIIIDIEASGFGPHSYPIEVGVALNDGTKYCSLILPGAEWTHWDMSAERVHHIPRAVLATHGKSTAEVAGRLNELLRRKTAYTDGWVVDKTWLDRLFFAAGMHCEFSYSSLEMILSEPQMAIWHPTKDALLQELGSPRHRASFDAYVIQQTYERTRRASACGGTAEKPGLASTDSAPVLES